MSSRSGVVGTRVRLRFDVYCSDGTFENDIVIKEGAVGAVIAENEDESGTVNVNFYGKELRKVPVGWLDPIIVCDICGKEIKTSTENPMDDDDNLHFFHEEGCPNFGKLGDNLIECYCSGICHPECDPESKEKENN